MKADEKYDFVLFLIIVGVVLVAVFAVVDTCRGYLGARDTAKLKCLEHGYPDVERAGGAWFCVGVRDGDTVVVPIEDLK